ncbi:hypothetical protein CSHISOI_08581 [Colletotrichum shisoi]|uniref:NB-ARC domain-containing protein n=1 Tax=Colletotrichum shisoi TaxID=2078593 RepID=A0A5Q4BJV8_9PEZI|nr:hypothetical protein CSHISOI_08581 [Colletotrichum shisoi]
MDPQMAFNGPLRGQSVVAGMSVSGGTANVHFHHAANNPPQTAPLRVLPFSRNEDVVVRPGIFSQLAQLLPVSEARNAALCGLGGSGKTQVALEFAYRRADDDGSCAIFWVHADTEATFTQDYALVARKAGLSALNGEELLTTVCHFIEAQPWWLLVLDNADDLRLFGVGATPSSEQSPSKSLNCYVPKGPTGSILWTSRDGRIAGSLIGSMRAIPISSMLPLEAQTLLATARGSDHKDDELDDAAALLSELHYIPLPVSQAAAYIRRTAMPIKKYLSRLRDGKKRWALLRKTDFDRHRREGVSNSILETWNITIELLEEEDKTAVKILHILAYFDNQNIPRKMIKAVAAAAAAVATADTSSELACEDSDGSRDFSYAESKSDADPDGNDQDAGDGDDIPDVTADDSDKGEQDAKDTIDAPSYATGHSVDIEEDTTDSDNTTGGSDEDTSDSDDATEDAVTRLREFSFLHMTTRPDGRQVYDMHKLVQEATLYSHGVEKNSSTSACHSQMAISILTNLFPEPKRENWEDCVT